ncbi:MAG: alpha/beta hydrolase [Betaproteobacteria bacterium]|jgi:Predicted hydrolase of the alpha/beta superfamily|nr:alpha/beta hydrolase [Betaproteobacteria bacterium]
MSTLNEETRLIPGLAGQMEVVVNHPPSGIIQGLALVAHPHPLFGGNLNNKVTQTLSRTLNTQNFVTWRMNSRGVGQTQGDYDEGRGETDDWITLYDLAQHEFPHLPLTLAGFSFGAYVMSEVARRLPPCRLILVAPAVGHFPIGTVPSDTLVVHGEQDTTVTLEAVLRWAEPQSLPILVIPGGDHFFHQRLILLRDWLLRFPLM